MKREGNADGREGERGESKRGREMQRQEEKGIVEGKGEKRGNVRGEGKC
jgi:hypothetical protein